MKKNLVKKCFLMLVVVLLLAPVLAGCTKEKAPQATGEITLVDLMDREAVSYTHLDVYKRQSRYVSTGMRSGECCPKKESLD